MSIYLIILVFLSINIVYDTTAADVDSSSRVRRYTLDPNLDRHPLITVGGGFYNSTVRKGILAQVGLEYPLDKNRSWNIEIIYYCLFRNNSTTTNDAGLLSFRRYLVSQANDIRPSFHLGIAAGSSIIALDIGVGIDITIVRRLLYSQICGRIPIGIIGRHSSSDGSTPPMITLSARIML